MAGDAPAACPAATLGPSTVIAKIGSVFVIPSGIESSLMTATA